MIDGHVLMVLRRDLSRIRQFGNTRMIQPGTLWCQIQVDQRTMDHLRHQSIWFEIVTH